MNALKQLRAPLVLIVGVAFLTSAGCAGTKPNETNATGTGGVGGIGGGGLPAINGLESLTVAPTSATVTLTAGAAGNLTSTAQKFTATGVVFGETKDVSALVDWYVDLKGVIVDPNGNATATAPGIYSITAKSGNLQAWATLTASFSGAIFDPGFNQTNNNKTVLDGAASGTTSITYPTDHALFPSNLSPIYAQMAAPGAGSIARLNFQATGLDINYYSNCVTTDDTNNNDPLPGTGCYVKMPLTLTQLFIATSERQDIKMTARVSNGGAPVESASINVAWANVGLSGGIYYWSTIPNTDPVTMARRWRTRPRSPQTTSCSIPTATNGTAIYRYDFTNGTPRRRSPGPTTAARRATRPTRARPRP